MKIPVLQRIEAKCMPIPESGCIVFLGSLTNDGYGRVKLDGRSCSVHRIVFELLVGRVPDGMELDHKCRVRSCCNPAHLEIVTHRENVIRGTSYIALKAAQTHCKRGHAFDETNTYLWRGNRICRLCRADYIRQRDALRRQGSVAGPSADSLGELRRQAPTLPGREPAPRPGILAKAFGIGSDAVHDKQHLRKGLIPDAEQSRRAPENVVPG